MSLTPAQFEDLTRPLIGLPLSLPWKGYGSSIFFELGELAPLTSKRQHHNAGAACIAVDWDWRVEAQGSVLYGSSSSKPEIERGIRSLRGKTVQSLSVVGAVPELEARFSNGHCLRSMAMVAGDPAWSIKTLDGRWITAKDGTVHIDAGTSALSVHEADAFAMAERTSIRWGIPELQPVAGRCAGCAWFIPLDGEGHLLDYGCCAAESSPFDGKVVARRSGCPEFSGAA